MRFGDNDNLAALTAVQLQADGVFLFTDVDYLYTANPNATRLRWRIGEKRGGREPFAMETCATKA